MSLCSVIRVKIPPSCWSGQNEDICPSIKKSTIRCFFELFVQKVFETNLNFRHQLKVSKYQKQFYVLPNFPKKQTKLTILSIFFTQDSEFRSFFGRIEESINCFRDLLTLRWRNSWILFVLHVPWVFYLAFVHKANWLQLNGKTLKVLKTSLIPSPSVKIQIMGGKVCLRCKGKTLLGVVNKLLKTKFIDITQQCFALLKVS